MRICAIPVGTVLTYWYCEYPDLRHTGIEYPDRIKNILGMLKMTKYKRYRTVSRYRYHMVIPNIFLNLIGTGTLPTYGTYLPFYWAGSLSKI